MASGARTRKDVEELLVGRAQADESFRKRLLAQPEKVLAEELGIRLTGIRLKVIEESPTELCLVLPPPNRLAGELVDAELDAVAGGTVGQVVCSDKSGAAQTNPMDPLQKKLAGGPIEGM